ncbi:hypothetical protein DWB77_07282 [Streptomyces hundungensis]|uniref:Uncharacterized protein n=1 Tax=Streptomyces hundungensis TaxID=1077946 RepID=A0A387HMC1_9ACTN|nr:hypothetical protein [Streptomyces hundungensis]AYG85066.1 hypothetical protein DWB77_07282 [Streptomyces hundungensis]
MIEQAYVQAGDVTTPTIATLRDRISQAIDDTRGASVLERLNGWLQMPTDSTFFTGMLDSLCGERAKDVGDRLSRDTGGRYDPADLSAASDIAAKWTAIGNILESGRAVTVKGPTGHVGGAMSKFKNKDGTGFHVIVLLATGQEQDGRRFVLGFDPDVSATAESRKAWVPFALGGAGTVAKVSAFSDARCTQVIKAMVLGDQQDGFGPLVRKYYVDTAATFPAIVRG